MPFEPYRPGYHHDPYPALAELRGRSPVFRHPSTGHVFVSGYELCAEVLRDDATYSSNLGRAGGELRQRAEGQRKLAPLGEVAMLGSTDPPLHTRLRKAVNQPFTPAAAEAMRPHIQQVVGDLVNSLPRGEPFDFVSAIADRLPSLVMLELLGVPRARQDDMARWLAAIGRVRENADFSPPAIEEAQDAHVQITNYVERVSEHGDEPGDNLVAMLLGGEEGEAPLTLAEVLSLVVHIALVGNGPAGGLLANGLLALMRNREQWDALRADPALIPNAVHELLRYDSPTHAVPRVALRDCDLEGVPLNRGDLLFAVVGAANRDPAQFESPEALDIARDARTHLSFGQGIHFCLGAPLARLEAAITFEALLSEMPNLELVPDSLQWSPAFELRTPDRMVLRAG